MAQHSPKLLEARRLGDLGFYKEAAEFYAAAEAEHPIPPLSLLVEISGFNIEQGLIGAVVDKLNLRTCQIDRSKEKPLELALFDLLWASAEASSKVRLAGPLAKAIGVFNEHLRDRAAADYDRQTAYLAVIYHGFCRVVDLVGFAKDDPPPVLTPELFRSLFDHLQRSGQHKVAFKVASCYGSLPESSSHVHMGLLDTLIDSDLPNDVLRAEIFLEYAETFEAQDEAEDASKYLELAESFYASAGHVGGPLYIRIKRLRKGTPSERQGRIESLFKIKSEFERFENWHGVRQALQALHQVNIEAPDDSLGTSLNVELLKLRKICRNDLDWVSQRMIIVHRWNFTHANIGQALQALEELYGEMRSMDAPVLLADIIMLLYDINIKIGDPDRANFWLSQQRHLLPRYLMILLNLEPFLQRLEATTSPPEPGREQQELEDELEATRRIISTTTGLDDRATEVRRVANIAHTYTTQHSIRTLDQTTMLVGMCSRFVNDCSGMLSNRDGKGLRATLLQAEATLKVIEASLPPFTIETMPGRIGSLLGASNLQNEALQLYLEIDNWISASMAKAQMANCFKTVWLHQGSSPDSGYFHKAVRLYVEATEMARKVHHITSVRLLTMNLLRLWYEGFQHKINIPVGDDGSERVTALQMVEKYLEKAEDLTNMQRNDLSALRNERSILAKQELRKSKDSLELYDIAVQVFATVDDNTPLWTWVQKAKARGVSDLLALGINLPGAMLAEINADPVLSHLVEEERCKQSDIETAPADHKFYMSTELEMHRTKMREYPLLSRMLDLREGRPVRIQNLRDLQQLQLQQEQRVEGSPENTSSSSSSTGPPETRRKLIFVDWFVFQTIYGMLVVTEDTIHAVATEFTIEAARTWKQNYLTHDFGQPHPLDEPDMTPLEDLSALVKPLLDLTNEGDLLVFCPTGFLHGIPIHAAMIPPGPSTSKTASGTFSKRSRRQSMIERNPIIYTSSMTTLSHCVSRELQRRDSGHGHSHDEDVNGNTSTAGKDVKSSSPSPSPSKPSSLSYSFVTVFEETDGDNGDVVDESWQTFRDDMIYKTTREIGSRFPESSICIGHEVSPQVLRNAFEFDMMYFFGHCHDRFDDDVLKQALVLAPCPPHQEEKELVAALSTLAKITDDVACTKVTPYTDANADADDNATSTSQSNGDGDGDTGNSATSSTRMKPMPPSVTTTTTTTSPAIRPQSASGRSNAGEKKTTDNIDDSVLVSLQHHFTVSDIFRSKVEASNVMLIACGSASESSTPGDEPLGIITSLLCAGASSVIGTLWKVEAAQGMNFSRRIYDLLLLSQANSNSTPELIEVVVGQASSTTTSSEGGGDGAHTTSTTNATRNRNRNEQFINLAIILQQVVCEMKRKHRVPFQWAPYILSGSWFVKA